HLHLSKENRYSPGTAPADARSRLGDQLKRAKPWLWRVDRERAHSERPESRLGDARELRATNQSPVERPRQVGARSSQPPQWHWSNQTEPALALAWPSHSVRSSD